MTTLPQFKIVALMALAIFAFTIPAHADLNAIRASERETQSAITAQQQTLANFISQIGQVVASRYAPAQAATAGAFKQASAAAEAVQKQAAAAMASVTTQAQTYLAQQAANGLAYLAQVARVAPGSYAAVYQQVLAAYQQLERQTREWLNGQLATAQSWLDTQRATITAWYNATTAPVWTEFAAEKAAGDQQIAEATRVVATQIAPLQKQLDDLEASEAFADCPFPYHAPMVACTLLGRPQNAFDVYVTLATSSGNRGFRLLIPSFLGAPVPLILDLHGLTGDSATQRRISQLDSYALRYGFILVEPDGVGKSWNAGSCCGQAKAEKLDDVGFIRDAIDFITSYGKVDTRRVFAVGLSNGGMMAQRLACAVSDKIAAVATVVGPNGELETIDGPSTYACAPGRAVPILMFYGTADTCVPFEGGRGICPVTAISAMDNFKHWSKINHCADTTPQVIGHNGAATGYGNPSCAANEQVQMVVVSGVHEWFGPSEGINTSELVLQFFAQHPM